MLVLVIMLVFTSGAYAFSYGAQPYSPLYGTKIFFERARVALTTSSAQDVHLEMDFSERRMEELRNMVSSGNQGGAQRWLHEYRRNIEGAGVLFDSISSQEAGELAGQFQEMLDEQAGMMQGMQQGQPSSLSEPIGEAYRVCDQERIRMRRRCGQQDPGSATQEPGGQQRQGECPGEGGSPQQQDQTSPTGTMPAGSGTGTGEAGSPADTTSGTSSGSPSDAPAETPADTSQSNGSQTVEGGPMTGGTGYKDEGMVRGHMP
jgi:hypothetical protein